MPLHVANVHVCFQICKENINSLKSPSNCVAAAFLRADAFLVRHAKHVSQWRQNFSLFYLGSGIVGFDERPYLSYGDKRVGLGLLW